MELERQVVGGRNYESCIKHISETWMRSLSRSKDDAKAARQLLLLGDQVEEAFEELHYSCLNIVAALPFRLMARLLECFQRNKVNQSCSYYANVLKRDPVCCYSLNRLVAMHKSGNCSTMLMFEMIALHLDAADGQSSIWEELASCFLQLQIVAQSEYEDCTPENLRRGWTQVVSSSEVPVVLKEENARGSWKLWFLWWKMTPLQ